MLKFDRKLNCWKLLLGQMPQGYSPSTSHNLHNVPPLHHYDMDAYQNLWFKEFAFGEKAAATKIITNTKRIFDLIETEIFP